MAWHSTDSDGPVVYMNVHDGIYEDRKTGNTYTVIDGYIGGVRLRDGYYNNQKTTKLEIKVIDPGTDGVPPAVISGSLIAQGNITTWGRMIVGRLINTKNNLVKGELLEFHVYKAGETRGACAALRRMGETEALPSANMHKDSPELCRELVEKGVAYLIGVYGTWGRNIAPADDEPQPEPEPERTGLDDDDLPF